MPVKQRLKDYISYKNLTISGFEKTIGVANGYVNSIVNSISQKKLEGITQHFPDLNKNWLIFGEGSMLLPEAEEIGYPDGTEDIKVSKSGNEFIDTDKGNSFMLVPLVEYNAYGGYLSGWGDPHFLEDLPKHMISVDVYNKGVYRAFRVRGDSMNDGSLESIIEGDIITGRIIDKPLWYSKFHMHDYKYFIIVHKEGILVKSIKFHNVEDGRITVSSLNPDKAMYPDREIYLSDVYEMMNVVDLYRKTKFL